MAWQDLIEYGTIRRVKSSTPLTEIYAPVAAPLEQVRAVVDSLWREVLQLVEMEYTDAMREHAEGKLLRPALCLMAAGAAGASDLTPFVRLAACSEIMHIASLAHDDVLDHSSLRRGRDSLNALWSNHAAVLGGDYLVAQAIELLTRYESPALIAAVMRSMRRMTEGELRFFNRAPESMAPEDCLVLAERKTASLFASACETPAILVQPEYRHPLHAFGTLTGIAFQVVDDVLDILQPSAALGKPACGDISEGKATLPLHYLREALSPDDRVRFAACQNRALSEQDCAWIRECAQQSGAAEKAMKTAEDHIQRALEILGSLPDSPCRQSMAAMACFILERPY